jgi:HTH-type transcriptional regulator/antitoxin HigA
MNINPIRTEQDYKVALQEVSRLVDLDPEVDSDEGARLEVLSTLVEVYESRHFPIEAPSPVEAIRFRMEQAGLTAKDLVPSIGKTNRVYEVLAGRRKLTIPMIRKLNKNLGIPAESLLGI